MTIGKKNEVTVNIAPGKHGDIIRKLYWERGKNCPNSNLSRPGAYILHSAEDTSSLLLVSLFLISQEDSKEDQWIT